MSNDKRFADVKRVLERNGFVLTRVSGSHHIFEKAGRRHHLSIPVHRGKVKIVYARRIEQAIKE